MHECWGKLTPETNYSINFPNTGVEITLPLPPLFFQCQNNVFLIEESIRLCNRTRKQHHSVYSRMSHQNILKRHWRVMFNTVSINFLPWKFPILLLAIGLSLKPYSTTSGIITVSTGRPLSPTPPFYKCTSWGPVRYTDWTKATESVGSRTNAWFAAHGSFQDTMPAASW